MMTRSVAYPPKASQRTSPARSSSPVRKPPASPVQPWQRKTGYQPLVSWRTYSREERNRPQLRVAPASEDRVGDHALRGAEARTAAFGGRPLTREQRAYFEPRFGVDFGQVRLHTDASADFAARAFGALAYTKGTDIVFRKGQYQPEGSSGRLLLAHELTHVVQQSGSGAAIQQSRVEPVDSPAEREAHHVAAQVMAGGQAPAIRHAPVGVPRAPLTSDGGEFVMTRYDAYDGDTGKNTSKSIGADLTITFTPKKALRSDQITFVQMMKAVKGGAPYLFPNEKARATTAKQGEAGWAVDQTPDHKNADYQMDNSGKEEPDFGQFGYRKSDDDVRDAVLMDIMRLPRGKGETFTVRATSFALDKTNGKYLGGVSWGIDADAKGSVTKRAAALQSKGAPTGIQKAALKKWNEQAKNADVSKRNDPNQVPITVP